MFLSNLNIKDRLSAILKFEIEFFHVTRIGIERMTRGILAETLTIVRDLTFIQLGFYAFCLIGFILAMLPWVDYRITFASEEYADVGSTSKLAYLLPSIAGALLATFNIPFRQWIYRIIAGLAGLLYVIGLIFPNPIHTSMVSGDFHVRFWTYLYGIALLVQAALSAQALTETTIHPERFQERLLPMLHPEEEPSPRKRSSKSARV
ncbi:MAG: hypothetical protein K8S54_20030 [Spirochaetia bacterium]|nr:hypothetical protein [Spirochaetia bacterium]